MNLAMPIRQRGLTLGGFIIGAILLVLFAITGMKVIPAYIEVAKIKNVFETIAHEPEMQKASLHDIRMAFDRQASIDSITAINSGDLEISVSESGRPVLSASYAVKVPLVANISLYIEFNPSSAGKK